MPKTNLSSTTPAIVADDNFTLKAYNGLKYEDNKEQFAEISHYNNEIKKQALAYVKEELEKSGLLQSNPKLAAAVATAFRTRSSGQPKEPSKTDLVAAIFENIGDSFTETQIFVDLKQGIGRRDMKLYIPIIKKTTGKTIEVKEENNELIYTLTAIDEPDNESEALV